MSREFFSLRQIAETARRENWTTGRALEESRKLLRRKRKAGIRKPPETWRATQETGE